MEREGEPDPCTDIVTDAHQCSHGQRARESPRRQSGPWLSTPEVSQGEVGKLASGKNIRGRPAPVNRRVPSPGNGLVADAAPQAE